MPRNRMTRATTRSAGAYVCPDDTTRSCGPSANPDIGVLVAVAIAVHNIPEEFAMAVPAVALRRRRFLIGAAVVSALAEPIGASSGSPASSSTPRSTPRSSPSPPGR